MKPFLIIVLLLASVSTSCTQPSQLPASKPNVIIIYTDDIGYGDLSSYGAKQIITPGLDKLADSGMRMTSAYATSSTCTPSRFSLLTGIYAFRNQQAQILDGDAPLLLDPEKPTLADLFKSAGYNTSLIGKWHLGLGTGSNEWNGDIKPGPLELGFDESFIVPTTVDRVPTVYVEGHRVLGLDPADPLLVQYKEQIGDLPTGVSHPELLRYGADPQHSGTIVNGVSRIGFQTGGTSAMWDDEMMTQELVTRTKAYITENKSTPFFLFLAMHQNHVPRVPHPDFVGKSGSGLRGDHTLELDWAVDEVMKTLDSLGIRENTLVIFSSDNGPVYDDGYADGAIEDANGHKANGVLRGGKYTTYEGGTRVPFIVSWPGVVKAGLVSDAAFSQIDIMASMASLIGIELPEDAGHDSMDHLSTLLGQDENDRPHVLQQGAGANYYGIRKGDWKLIPASPRPAFANNKHNGRPNPISTPMPAANQDYLYNLADDPGETTNLASQHPEIVNELKALLESIKTTSDREILVTQEK